MSTSRISVRRTLPKPWSNSRARTTPGPERLAEVSRLIRQGLEMQLAALKLKDVDADVRGRFLSCICPEGSRLVVSTSGLWVAPKLDPESMRCDALEPVHEALGADKLLAPPPAAGPAGTLAPAAAAALSHSGRVAAPPSETSGQPPGQLAAVAPPNPPPSDAPRPTTMEAPRAAPRGAPRAAPMARGVVAGAPTAGSSASSSRPAPGAVSQRSTPSLTLAETEPARPATRREDRFEELASHAEERASHSARPAASQKLKVGEKRPAPKKAIMTAFESGTRLRECLNQIGEPHTDKDTKEDLRQRLYHAYLERGVDTSACRPDPAKWFGDHENRSADVAKWPAPKAPEKATRTAFESVTRLRECLNQIGEPHTDKDTIHDLRQRLYHAYLERGVGMSACRPEPAKWFGEIGEKDAGGEFETEKESEGHTEVALPNKAKTTDFRDMDKLRAALNRNKIAFGPSQPRDELRRLLYDFYAKRGIDMSECDPDPSRWFGSEAGRGTEEDEGDGLGAPEQEADEGSADGGSPSRGAGASEAGSPGRDAAPPRCRESLAEPGIQLDRADVVDIKDAETTWNCKSTVKSLSAPNLQRYFRKHFPTVVQQFPRICEMGGARRSGLPALLILIAHHLGWRPMTERSHSGPGYFLRLQETGCLVAEFKRHYPVGPSVDGSDAHVQEGEQLHGDLKSRHAPGSRTPLPLHRPDAASRTVPPPHPLGRPAGALSPARPAAADTLNAAPPAAGPGPARREREEEEREAPGPSRKRRVIDMDEELEASCVAPDAARPRRTAG
eukprot:tig00000821_g4496.t1